MRELKDRVLVQRIQKGDRSAFKKMYDRYHEELYFLAKRYLRDQHLAEDAVQDIFLKIWSKRKMLRGSSFKGFLFTTMKNHLIDTIRRQKTSTEVKEGLKKISKDERRRNTTIEKVIYAEYRKLVEQAMENISPEERKVFEMKNFEGLSNAEIAAQKEVSIHTVKTQSYLGSKYVRNFLKKHGGFGN